MKNCKKIINTLLLIGFFVLPFNSCNDDQLEILNPNTVAEGEFFQNEADFRLAVNGMFHPITAVFFWGRVVHTGAMLRSDAFNVVPFDTNTQMSTLQGVPGVSRWSTDMFPQLYQTIFRANVIIELANEENLPDQNVRNQIVGQAHFMRAFANWYLAALWGNVPLVMERSVDSEDFFPSQSTQDEVFTAVTQDLAIAAAMLPTQWENESDLGRPTSGSALALKGKTHLYLQEYSQAMTDLRQVVSSGQYDLLPAALYGQNFSGLESEENNIESVFELQFLGQQDFAWGADIPGTGTQGNYFIDYAPPNVSPDNGHFINPHIFQTFEDNGDTVRRNATIGFDYPGATGYGGVPFAEDFAQDIAEANTRGVEPYFTRKYAAYEAGTRASIPNLGQTIGNNWRIIRYADVLLMLAEAENEMGNTGEAINLVNQVRARAEITPLDSSLNQDQVFDAIVDERVMELTGEGHRFFDLVRWGLAEEVLGQNSTIANGRHPKSLAGTDGAFTAFFTPGQDELIWIPVPQLQANPNLVQNPGY